MQHILDYGEVRTAKSGAVAVLHAGDGWRVVVIKTTGDKTENYLKTYYTSSAFRVAALRRSGALVREAY